jgi:hypothetical protein
MINIAVSVANAYPYYVHGQMVVAKVEGQNNASHAELLSVIALQVLVHASFA